MADVLWPVWLLAGAGFALAAALFGVRVADRPTRSPRRRTRRVRLVQRLRAATAGER